jgi:hypothetical protein
MLDLLLVLVLLLLVFCAPAMARAVVCGLAASFTGPRGWTRDTAQIEGDGEGWRSPAGLTDCPVYAVAMVAGIVPAGRATTRIEDRSIVP